MIDFLREIQTYGAQFDPTVKGSDVWIKCPFHGHGQERTPSCRINLVKGKYPAGFFYCYGCGKHGHWNDLIEGIPKLTPLDDEEIKHQETIITRLTPDQRASLLEEDTGEYIDFNSMINWNKNQIWRKINGKLLNSIGAKKFFNPKINTNQLFLPCYQNKKFRGGIKAVIERVPGQIGYFNTSGNWVKKSLFPYDYTKSIMKQAGNFVTLVEGPRDALNLLQGGIPALAILGSQNWSKDKLNLVYLLNPDLIVLAFDNDEAGNKATQKISNSFLDKSQLLQLQFKPGQDPGDLTIEEIHQYHKKILKYITCKNFNK